MSGERTDGGVSDNFSTQTTTMTSSLSANRDITCFEVLDYDSLTYVSVGEEHFNVIALIYKKVTIKHSQTRLLNLEEEFSNTFNFKGVQFASWEPTGSEIDNFSYDGTRTVEYIFALVVGNRLYTKSLGTVVITNTGKYNRSGTHKEVVEEGCDPSYPCTYVETIEGPTFTIAGNRLYGVSVNCGAELVTYSYDLEVFNGEYNEETDSPTNIEDCNNNWSKISRIIGVYDYVGASTDKVYTYGNDKEIPEGFPDTVMAVGYGYTNTTIGE